MSSNHLLEVIVFVSEVIVFVSIKEPLERQIKHPKCLIVDFGKPEVNEHFVGLREAAERAWELVPFCQVFLIKVVFIYLELTPKN